MPASTALTIKQRRFLRHYIKSGNGTQAALVAYDVTDANTARSIATENLRKPALRTALAALLETQGLSNRALRRIHAHYLALYASPDPASRRSASRPSIWPIGSREPTPLSATRSMSPSPGGAQTSYSGSPSWASGRSASGRRDRTRSGAKRKGPPGDRVGPSPCAGRPPPHQLANSANPRGGPPPALNYGLRPYVSALAVTAR
jgi:hypothetical protein